jgi:transcriptional regulator of arginine metabolism
MSISPLPKTKVARRERVAELISTHTIHSQADLATLLKREGLSVTQATLSRDLDELGAIKVRDDDGFLFYTLPAGDGHGDQAAHLLSQRIEEFVLSVDHSGDLVIVRTPPGGAQLLASSFDRFAAVSGVTQILGTVAGDDTILLIARQGAGASVSSSIRGIAEGATTSESLKGKKQGRVRT